MNNVFMAIIAVLLHKEGVTQLLSSAQMSLELRGPVVLKWISWVGGRRNLKRITEADLRYPAAIDLQRHHF